MACIALILSVLGYGDCLDQIRASWIPFKRETTLAIRGETKCKHLTVWVVLVLLSEGELIPHAVTVG